MRFHLTESASAARSSDAIEPVSSALSLLGGPCLEDAAQLLDAPPLQAGDPDEVGREPSPRALVQLLLAGLNVAPSFGPLVPEGEHAERPLLLSAVGLQGAQQLAPLTLEVHPLLPVRLLFELQQAARHEGGCDLLAPRLNC